MWTIFKYVIDGPNPEHKESSETNNESPEDKRLEDVLESIKNQVDKNAENYIISLHYLEFPIVLHFGINKLKETQNLKIIHDYIEPIKEVRKILLSNQEDYVQGFYFLQKQIAIQKEILYSLDMDTFDRRASESGLEPYIINDLRTMWKNRRLDQLQKSLARHVEVYYRPNVDHPLYTAFQSFLEETYKRGVDRFKTFICIGSTFIGKSVFFSKFIVPEEYYVYHSNYLEYSKMPNQPSKIFRVLDDINWDQVTSTELKSLMNRNISSVNIKYGYEYIFPLIPIIIMNGEDYKVFRQHFSDIWLFIEKNAVIYPPQKGKEVREEKESLFTSEIATMTDSSEYLFSKIMDVKKLKECTMNNMNEWIKKELFRTERWKYDVTRYLQFPENKEIRIPNPEKDRKTVLKQYEEYLLRKKVKEMDNEGKEDEKKPREPWYKSYYEFKKNQPQQSYQKKIAKKPKKSTKFDDLNTDFDDYDDDETDYKGKKSKYDSDDDGDDYDDDDDDDDDDEMSEDDSEDDEGDTTLDGGFGKGFVTI